MGHRLLSPTWRGDGDEIAYATAREAARPGVSKAELYGLCYAAVAKEAGESLCFTFVIGRKPTTDERKVHVMLCKAMDAGIKTLRPGAPAKEVYRAVHGVLDRAGWGKDFLHHAGHATGCHPHEQPTFTPANRVELQPGAVCTLDPGVYRDGVGGMHIE